MIEPISFCLNFHKFGKSDLIQLSPGLHVIYGESGCGKSYFIRSLAGIPSHQDGNFLMMDISAPESIQIVFQNPDNQILSHTLLSELTFAPECFSTDTYTLQEQLKILKSDLPFVDNWNRHPASLSGGEMEMLNLVTAFSTNPDLVLIDDGLSFLNENAKSEWVSWIRKKLEEEKTVIWFTSDQNDLYYGDSQWVMSLSEFSSFRDHHKPKINKYKHPNGELSVKVDELNFQFDGSKEPIINNFNFFIDQSRAVGLIGKNGIGKTTFSKLITGQLDPQAGKVELVINGKTPKVATLNQFPERMLGAGSLDSFLTKLIVNEKMNQRLVNKCINRLNSYQINWEIIKGYSALDIPWPTLRIALIIILSHCNYDVLILDEPTFGLGWEQKVILSRFIQEMLVKKHMILISHDQTFVLSHCDQILNLDSRSIQFNQSVLTHAE